MEPVKANKGCGCGLKPNINAGETLNGQAIRQIPVNNPVNFDVSKFNDYLNSSGILQNLKSTDKQTISGSLRLLYNDTCNSCVPLEVANLAQNSDVLLNNGLISSDTAKFLILSAIAATTLNRVNS